MKLTTAGESHGKGIFAIIEGLPAHLPVKPEKIDAALAARQRGYGRGGRQKIESDKVEILSGVRGGETHGSPLTLAIYNKDYANWESVMSPENGDFSRRVLTKVRPGHADLTGMRKFMQTDARNVLERASARETAARVAAGAIVRELLTELNIEVTGYVKSVCGVVDPAEYTFDEIVSGRGDRLLMISSKAEAAAMKEIDLAKERGDTCGGVVELRVRGLKSGFGSCMTYSQKLDARLAFALMSVQAIKGVEIGAGFSAATKNGSEVQDEIYFEETRGFYRKTNRAGGIEGGMSNGEELVLRAAMKPIPTLMKGLKTVDFITKEAATAAPERSDTCAIAACETVCESAVIFELGSAIIERLGGDTLSEIKERYGRLV